MLVFTGGVVKPEIRNMLYNTYCLVFNLNINNYLSIFYFIMSIIILFQLIKILIYILFYYIIKMLLKLYQYIMRLSSKLHVRIAINFITIRSLILDLLISYYCGITFLIFLSVFSRLISIIFDHIFRNINFINIFDLFYDSSEADFKENNFEIPLVSQMSMFNFNFGNGANILNQNLNPRLPPVDVDNVMNYGRKHDQSYKIDLRHITETSQSYQIDLRYITETPQSYQIDLRYIMDNENVQDIRFFFIIVINITSKKEFVFIYVYEYTYNNKGKFKYNYKHKKK